jgi:hypothetical protein
VVEAMWNARASPLSIVVNPKFWKVLRLPSFAITAVHSAGFIYPPELLVASLSRDSACFSFLALTSSAVNVSTP